MVATSLARGRHFFERISCRLGILGFFDLSHHHEDYADSGNVGMLDIVAALAWIRDNIVAFGGETSALIHLYAEGETPEASEELAAELRAIVEEIEQGEAATART